MTKDIIDFKTHSEYFDDEKNGIKNNTVRVLDTNDERFQKLLRAWKNKDYPIIRINHSQLVYQDSDKAQNSICDQQYSFIRTITHIALFNNLMIITWYHPKGEK